MTSLLLLLALKATPITHPPVLVPICYRNPFTCPGPAVPIRQHDGKGPRK